MLPEMAEGRTKSMISVRAFFFKVTAALLLSGAWSSPFAIQCGTAQFLENGLRPRPSAKLAIGLRTEAGDYRARTLVTDHFLINYSLRGLHKVRTGPEDSTVMRAYDSLYRAFSAGNLSAGTSAALNQASRDSAVYAKLDGLGAPAPAFIQRTAAYAEGAWAYYVIKLGMLPPRSPVNTVQYNVTAKLPSRFPIDVVDVGTADRMFWGETYAVTYPDADLSISLDNDFLWNTHLDSQGKIVGDTIESRLGGKVIHNYGVDWDMGLKVTLFHEFYHAVQFTYLPNTDPSHAWYEISAVSMEERNAPEVNDYFQYLPCVLYNHDRVSITQLTPGPCTHIPMYGHAIFHQYLTKVLDSAFDVSVWDHLRTNGNDLEKALQATFARYGKSFSDIYPDYASRLLFTGKKFKPIQIPYTADLPDWPILSVDSLDLSREAGIRTIAFPPLTFGVLKVQWTGRSAVKTISCKGINGARRIYAGPDTSFAEPLSGTTINLGQPKRGFSGYYLLLPNASYTDTVSITVSTAEPVCYAYPNPAPRGSGISFTMPSNISYPDSLQILSENGELIRTIAIPTEEDALAWDGKDNTAKSVAQGLYYYRLGKAAWRPLILTK